MLPKSLEEITAEDLHSLVEYQVREGKEIEFKLAFYKTTVSDSKLRESEISELVKDLSSFANTNGGDLLFGIREKSGFASEIVGIDRNDIEHCKRQLVEFANHQIDPRIVFDARAVDISSRNSVLITRIRKSHLAPHRSQKNSQFYARTIYGAYPMSTTELRDAFSLWSSTFQRMQQFVTSRSLRVLDDPMIDKESKLTCHMLPIEAFSSLNRIDISVLEKIQRELLVRPLQSDFQANGTFNFDGLRYASHSQPVSGYVQLFRNGTLEIALGNVVENSSRGHTVRLYLLRNLIERLDEYLEILTAMGMKPPIWICVNLTGVKGSRLSESGYGPINTTSIDRFGLHCPELEVRELGKLSSTNILQPIMDSIWNSVGESRSSFFSRDGKYLPRESS